MSDLPFWYIPLCYFVFGLCFGSFLNVVALRGLSGEDMVFARSKCPKCGNKLKWYMNIPLLSYIFLRGKCAFCKTRISPQYPIVEFLTALLFLFVYLKFGFTVKSIFMCAFSFFFILIALTDILETVILDYHAYILCVLGLIYSVLPQSDISIISSVIGAVSGFLIFEILSKIGEFLANLRMFGEGDSLIALALGAIFGIKGLLIITALSFLVQTVFAIPILIINSFKDKKYKLGITYIFILFSILLIILANYFDLVSNTGIYTAIVSVISILLLFSLKVIISDIKEKKKLFDKEDEFENIIDKSGYSIMPFGPALIISGFICMFFMENIKAVLITLIY